MEETDTFYLFKANQAHKYTLKMLGEGGGGVGRHLKSTNLNDINIQIAMEKNINQICYLEMQDD